MPDYANSGISYFIDRASGLVQLESLHSCLGAGCVFETEALQDLRATLSRISQLLPGWDGDDAAPPSRTACTVAEGVLDLCGEVGRLPDRLVADVAGGVALYFFGGELMPDGGRRRVAGMLIDNAGELYLYREQRGAPSEVGLTIAPPVSGRHRAELKDVIAFVDA